LILNASPAASTMYVGGNAVVSTRWADRLGGRI
jgi:hypothetical protein